MVQSNEIKMAAFANGKWQGDVEILKEIAPTLRIISKEELKKLYADRINRELHFFEIIKDHNPDDLKDINI